MKGRMDGKEGQGKGKADWRVGKGGEREGRQREGRGGEGCRSEG